MFSIGNRRRFLSRAAGQLAQPGLRSSLSPAPKPNDIVKLRKLKAGEDDNGNPGTYQEQAEYQNGAMISANIGGGSSGAIAPSGGSTGFGNSSAKIDRFNPVYDDLSRGTVAEDWIPRDPKLQNRMFRMMYARGAIEGPVVEMISEMVWSDFDLTGIRDKQILDTFWAAKDAVRVETFLDSITKEFLVIGRAVVQCVMDPNSGLWTDVIIFDSDYLKVTPIPRTGFMPKVDLIPDPMLQEWVKSRDPRDVESRKGIPQKFLDLLGTNKAVPLDPNITAYLPRKSFYNDVFGTSFYVRNIPLWGLEKSLINATLTGHRRRSGPITQIAVGSENWEPTPEQIDAYASAYMAAEEDPVSSAIGTRYDVQFNQIRGGLQEMWKWQDEWSFIQEAKLKMFGVSDQLVTGDANIDTTTAPTVFLERLKAHRRYIVEHFLMQKFFRGLAQVHGFRKRSEAELSHRVRIQNDDHELILPSLVFHRNLDVAADSVRADLLDKMEEKGLPVSLGEWSRALGGGDVMERFRQTGQDIELRLRAMRLIQLRQEVGEMQEGAKDEANIEKRVKEMADRLKGIRFGLDEDGYDTVKMTEKSKERAEEMADGDPEPVKEARTFEDKPEEPKEKVSSASFQEVLATVNPSTPDDASIQALRFGMADALKSNMRKLVASVTDPLAKDVIAPGDGLSAGDKSAL